MSWKNLSIWLKSGIIFSILSIILSIINLILENSLDFVDYQKFAILNLFINLPGESLMGIFSNKLLMCIYKSGIVSQCPNHQLLVTLTYFLTAIFYFAMGIIVGFFHNKLRNK